jgi:hypothetical protein
MGMSEPRVGGSTGAVNNTCWDVCEQGLRVHQWLAAWRYNQGRRWHMASCLCHIVTGEETRAAQVVLVEILASSWLRLLFTLLFMLFLSCVLPPGA